MHCSEAVLELYLVF